MCRRDGDRPDRLLATETETGRMGMELSPRWTDRGTVVHKIHVAYGANPIAACLFAQGPGSGNGPGKPNDPTAGGIKRTGESIDADGSKTSFEYTAKYDGKDYPVSGP